MGSEPSEVGHQREEAPRHLTMITKPFAMGIYPITGEEFRLFRQDTEWFLRPELIWHEGRYPAINIRIEDIKLFLAWLSMQTGATYRLPTEAEWEYAARAGTRTRFPAGDDPLVLLKTANTFDRETALRWPRWRDQAGAGSDHYPFTAPVGSFAPNAFGLYDMIGNAWEWCADWYGEDYYAQSPASDPTGPADGNVRVRRGGSWHSWPLYARVAFRNWNTPETRYVLVGFRLLRER